MHFKLSLRNVKKSFKDYTIYFLTLTLGVCIFYLFNSVESQSAMLLISESQMEILKGLTEIMGVLSVFVAVVLGFLIIYASNFLIRRRKKELGIYMTLGMQKMGISKILVFETLIIGLFSLVVGLISGVLLSHGFSIITASMFEVNLSQFHFIFSPEAALKTVIYFSLIFFVVMLFNMLIISKLKLINLIYGEKQNQELKIKNTKLSIILFILSILILGTAYYVIIKQGLLEISVIITCVILGTIGTYLFFVSLSGFLLKILQKNNKLYFKQLNMFIFRQFSSRINSTHISMTIICLLLFLTIGILSTGTSLSNLFSEDIESTTKFDNTIMTYDGDNNINDLNEYFSENDLDLTEYFKEYVDYQIYDSNLTIAEVLENSNIEVDSNMVEHNGIFKQYVIKLSDYNKLAKMQGLEEETLAENEYFIVANNEEFINLWDDFLSEDNSMTINEHIFIPRYNKHLETLLANNFGKYNFGTVVVNDEAVTGLDTITYNLSGNYYDEDKEIIEKSFIEDIEKINQGDGAYLLQTSKLSIYENSLSIKIVISYLGIYLGIVFLIASAAILALGQLSESADNVVKYNLLKKLGTSKEMINKAIFANVIITFMTPLSLAIVHSVFGIKVVTDTLKSLGNINILSSIIYTAIFVIIVYGGYFLITYLGVKTVINQDK